MRPHSDIRVALVAVLAQQGGTCRELAARTQVGLRAAQYTLANMQRPPLVQAMVAKIVRVPGVNRPVPYYELALQSAPLEQPSPGLLLQSVWCRAAAPAVPDRFSTLP